MPILHRPLFLVVVLVYLLLVGGIGVWAARRTRTPRDFFIAGQRAGLLATGLATMSAAFSSFVFLGGPGLTYRLGLASLWIVLPVGITAALLSWVLAGRLRMLAAVREIYTVPDAIACRFGSPTATALAALAVVLGTLAYLALQLRGLGVLLQAVFDLHSLGLAIGLGLFLLLAYSIFGGMLAGLYTDVLQGGLMLVTAVAVFALALRATGGWRALTGSIRESSAFGPEFFEPFGSLGAAGAFGLFLVFGVGVLGQPHMLHKFYMIDDPRKLRWFPLILGGSQVVCLLVWLGIGLAVPALVAQGALAPLGRPDDATPLFILQYAPDLLGGLVIAGILAAIMSTADSFMNIGAAALSRDLPRAFGRPLRRELAAARLALVLLAAMAAFCGWAYRDLIAMLGTLAFGVFAAALAPCLAIGLNWARVTAPAAIASIGTGLGLTLLFELKSMPPMLRLTAGVPPAALGLAASFLVLILVTLVGPKPRRPLNADLHRIVEG